VKKKSPTSAWRRSTCSTRKTPARRDWANNTPSEVAEAAAAAEAAEAVAEAAAVAAAAAAVAAEAVAVVIG
jgi:hypothetical protein